jgi:hypothetical protein
LPDGWNLYTANPVGGKLAVILQGVSRSLWHKDCQTFPEEENINPSATGVNEVIRIDSELS